jgi:mRNA-degrading endonuclease RelE of RelBE toxin-antitoxin system
VKSFARPSFWRAYEQLDDRTREAARKAYRLFEQDPGHPSLQFKKLGGYERIWSVRISAQYRAVGERHADTISWAWIGTHNEFDKLFR